MADSNFRGPLTSMGALEVNAATAAVEPLDGPAILYQGDALADIRSAPFAKDGFRPGQQAAVLAGASLWACDNIPQARTSTMLAVAQTGTVSVAVALATVGGAGVASVATLAVGVPIIPTGTTVATVAALAIDFGFTTGTTVTNSSTVAVIDNTLFKVGQWIVVGNVGNSAATRSLIAQVQSIATSNTTGITISPVAATGLASVPIGQANLYGSEMLPAGYNFGPSNQSASAHAFGGGLQAGLAKVMNPRETLARNVMMFASTINTYSALVSGWDVWGNPMTELLSLSAQTTVAGKKAFKYIGSIVSGTASVGQVSFGLGDTFGYPFRVDEWDQTEVTWNNAYATNANGFTAAVTTNPATNTTGDVRGTVQISTAILTGVLATSVSAVATNGTSRVTMLQNIGVWNQVYGTPTNQAPMFGVAQSTT